MRKIVMMSVVLLCSLGYLMLHYAAFARGGGESFIGGFGGAMVGSTLATAATSRSSDRSDSSGREALREVDRLEGIMRSDLTTLNSRIDDLEKDIPSTEDITLLAKEIKDLKQTVQELERDTEKELGVFDKRLNDQDKKIAVLEDAMRAQFEGETTKTESVTSATVPVVVPEQEAIQQLEK